jgi:hypothetical protein
MPLPPARTVRTVRDNLPPTPTRCPTCDREGCGVAAAGSFEWTSRTHLDAWRAATSDCQGHAVDWRARALAAEADAARWRKVAPLIATLHRAALIGASHTELIAAVAEVTAATQEPTL